jgi:hypothetical protein
MLIAKNLSMMLEISRLEELLQLICGKLRGRNVTALFPSGVTPRCARRGGIDDFGG